MSAGASGAIFGVIGGLIGWFTETEDGLET